LCSHDELIGENRRGLINTGDKIVNEQGEGSWQRRFSGIIELARGRA